MSPLGDTVWWTLMVLLLLTTCCGTSIVVKATDKVGAEAAYALWNEMDAVETSCDGARAGDSLESVYSLAVAAYEAQDWTAAVRCFRLVARYSADHVPTWMFLSQLLVHRLHRLEEAVPCLEQAALLSPEDPQVGLLLAQVRQLVAVDSEAPQDPLAAVHAVVGLAAHECRQGGGDVRPCEQQFRRALQLAHSPAQEPGVGLETWVWYYGSLAEVQEELGRPHDAVETLTRALERLPALPVARGAHATASLDQMRVSRAKVLTRIGRHSDALATLQQVAERQSDNVDVHFELGKALALAQQLPQAREHMQHVLALMQRGVSVPHKDRVLYASGLILRAMRYHGDALDTFRQAVQLNPDEDSYMCAYMHALMMVAQWDEYEEHIGAYVGNVTQSLRFASCLHPFSAILMDFPVHTQVKLCEREAESALATAVARAESLSLQIPMHNMKPTGVPKSGKERLRVGYVSSNFINHAQGSQFAQFFTFTNVDRHEVILFSTRAAQTEAAQLAVESIHVENVTKWVDLAMLPIEEAARVIVSHEVDVLVDLCGWVDDSRLDMFAFRPAPVQVSWLGFPMTTGAPFMDYYVGDTVSTPLDGVGALFSEKLLLMPHTYQLAEHRNVDSYAVEMDPLAVQKILDLDERPLPMESGGDDDTVVLCNFNQASKIKRSTFRLWMHILHEVPHAVFWLLSLPSEARPRLERWAREEGVPEHRIYWCDSISKPLHLQRVTRAHLLLDTLVYNGHTSAADALWAGVPLLTVPGHSMASRVATSLVVAAGFPEMSVDSVQEYQEKAIAWASDLPFLMRLKARMREQRMWSAVFDTAAFMHALESGLWYAWNRWNNGLEPQTAHVEQMDEWLQWTTNQS